MHKFIKTWLGRYVNSKERAVRKKAKMCWMNLQMKLNAMALLPDDSPLKHIGIQEEKEVELKDWEKVGGLISKYEN